MQQGQGAQLSLEDRRLLNVLEIKIYDLSENLEILTKQLTTNQIKDVVSQTYSIFCQLRRIFEKVEAMFLYEILRKMQINIVMVCSVLTDRVEQADQKTTPIRSNSQPETPSEPIPAIQPQAANLNIGLLEKLPLKIPKLGGINLYNECYRRGLEYYQVTDINNLQQLAGKCRMKQSKKFKEELLQSVARELENTSDLETETINDEIKNYIREYKENSKIGSCVSYQKELSEIIDFFKMSEMDAMNFLNKSPKNSKEHGEDFINRLDDMERDIKVRQSNEKDNIHEKMKFFIAKLKEKMLQIQKNYEIRNAKLVEFQKSLKKETVAFGTQTYDGYERKLKQLQNNIKQTEEKYLILTQMRKKQFNFQDQIYDLNHQLHVKSNQNSKLTQINLQQEDQLQNLKKIIRENKEKMNLPVQLQRKKPKNKAKLLKEFMSRSNEQNKAYLEKGRDQAGHDYETLPHGRESRAERKTKRFEKLGTPRTSGMFRPSIDFEQVQRLEKVYEQTKDVQNQRAEYAKKGSILSALSNKDTTQPVEESREKKDSVFKNQHRKALKKQSEEEKQVSFNVTEQSIMASRQGSTAKIQDTKFRQRMAENTRSIQLIDGSRFDRDQQEEESYSRRALRKNTLKQKIELSIASNRSLQNYQKKSNKSIGKSYLQKENKQRNTIFSSLKLSNLTIKEQFSINLQLQSVLSVYRQKSKSRQQRSSYQLGVNRNNAQNADANIQAAAKVNNLYKELKNKVRANNQSIHNLPNRSLGHEKTEEDLAGRHSIKAIDDRIRNISKKQNNPYNQVRKQASISTFLTKKSKKEIIKHSPKLQKLTVNKHIASCLKISLLKKSELSSEEWTEYIKTMPAEQVALTNLIQEKIRQQNLNMKQFQQIMSILEECEDTIKQKSYFSVYEKKKDESSKLPDRQFEKDGGKWPLNIVSLMRMKEIHVKMGHCSVREDSICQHIEKYLSILRKINDFTYHSKLALRLPIEKIGEQSFLKNTQARFSLNHQPAKKNQHRNDSFIDQPTQNRRIQQIHQQFQSTSDQKERILPIISKNKSYNGKARVGK